MLSVAKWLAGVSAAALAITGYDGMARRAAESSAKRAKKEKEDPLVRRREELILEVANARVALKAQGNKAVREATESLMQALRAVCAKLEAKNRNELLKKLPDELWEKIIDENVQQNDLLALASTCRFFREKQEDLGWEWLVTKLELYRRLDERKSGQKLSHSLDWFRWVCDTFEILPGFKRPYERVKGAVYEGDLVNCAALQGSVEILTWLVEEKGCELNKDTGLWAGHGGCVEVLENLKVKGYEFTVDVSDRAARGGHLKALKWFRQQLLLKPYVYLDRDEYGPYIRITWEGPLVAKCLKIAERNNHEDTASWLRSELTHLSNIPQLPESDSDWSGSLW